MRIYSVCGHSLVAERDLAKVQAGFRLSLTAPTTQTAQKGGLCVFKSGDKGVNSGDKGQKTTKSKGRMPVRGVVNRPFFSKP